MPTLKELCKMIQIEKDFRKKNQKELLILRKAYLLKHLDPHLPPELANIVWEYIGSDYNLLSNKNRIFISFVFCHAFYIPKIYFRKRFWVWFF